MNRKEKSKIDTGIEGYLSIRQEKQMVQSLILKKWKKKENEIYLLINSSLKKFGKKSLDN